MDFKEAHEKVNQKYGEVFKSLADNDLHAEVSDNFKEPLGYKLHDEQFLICPGCNAKLASVIVVMLNSPMKIGRDLVTKADFLAECPKCKVKSFKKSFNNVKVYYGAVPPYEMIDTETYIHNDTLIVFIKVKNEQT